MRKMFFFLSLLVCVFVFFVSVHFRYVVFHPFLDEILMGKIKGCSPEGVHVSLGFFDDIVIPPESLQQPAKLYPLHKMFMNV
ncbi:hypothetical protein AB205_0102750, partial [Aquarana catesbeiana]